MSKKRKIAFACYLIAAVLTLIFGAIYFFRTEIMPYHLEVLGVKWEDIQPEFQFMFLSFINGAGAVSLAQGAAILFILFIPFRNKEDWAKWAITLSGLISGLPLLYIVLRVKLLTPASPPLSLVIAINLLYILGFLFSMELNKTKKA